MGPEEYGEDYKFPHQLPDGTVVWLFVCRYGQARFFTSSGEQRGPEHESIAAAVEYVVAEGWHEWGGYDKHEREALRESIWSGAKGDSPATGPHRRVTIVDRGTGKQTSINLASADDRQLMRLAGLTKSAPRMRRNPETTPPMTRDEFIALIEQLAPADRQIRCPKPALGGTGVYVNYINLPPGVGSAGGGAEAENNRMMFTISDGHGHWSPERVKIEQSVSALPREYRLRAKSGPPAAIAKYLVAFLAKVAAEVPPKFTHTHRPNQSNAMTRLQRNEHMVVLTEEDFESLPKAQATEWGGYRYKMAYEVVTPESAEEGEASERGWEEEGSERYDYLDEVLRAVNDHSWLEWSDSHPSARSWIISEASQNFRTGEDTSYSLWIERGDGQPLSREELQHINDELGLRATFSPNARVQEEGAGDFAVEFTTPTQKHRIRRTTLQAASDAAITAQRQHGVPVDVKNKRKVVMKISKAGKVARPGATRAPARSMRRNNSDVVPRKVVPVDLGGIYRRGERHHNPDPQENGESFSYGYVKRVSQGDGWYLVEDATGSDYSGGSIAKSNYRVLEKMLAEAYPVGATPAVWATAQGGHNTFAIVVRWDDLNGDIQEAIAGLEDYPILSEDDHSNLELEMQSDAWENFYKREFARQLDKEIEAASNHEGGVELDDGQLYELFRYGEEAFNVDWEDREGEGASIDYERIAKGLAALICSDDDLKSWATAEQKQVVVAVRAQIYGEGAGGEEDDEEAGFDEGFVEELAKARFPDAHRIDVVREHGGLYVQVDDDPDEPTKSYSVVKTGNGQGFQRSEYDFEEL